MRSLLFGGLEMSAVSADDAASNLCAGVAGGLACEVVAHAVDDNGFADNLL